MLNSRPKQSPAAHPGQGKRAAPMTNPIPKRAMKAAVMAALLSGKLIGSMIPMSMAPKTNDMRPFRLLLNLAFLVNQLIRPMSRCDLQFPSPVGPIRPPWSKIR